MPFNRRIPKCCFRPVSRDPVAVVNLGQLATFPAGSTVGPEELRARGLERGRHPVKCLAGGTLPHALTRRFQPLRKRARELIAPAGGTAQPPPPCRLSQRPAVGQALT